MTFIIPDKKTRKHLQTNKDEYSGTIYQSRNINLDEDGKIQLSPFAYAVMTEDDDADFNGIDAMSPMDDRIGANSKEYFTGDISYDTFSNREGDTNAPSPGPEDDLIFFNETEVVSDSTVVKYQSAASTWTTVSSVMPSGTEPFAMTTWDAENVLVCGKNNLVKFIDTSWAISGTILTLPPQYQVSSMATSGSQLFIATRSDSGGEAKVFVVGAIQTGADNVYGVGTWEMPTIKSFKSTVVGLNVIGQLLRFNGGGFEEIASLPIYVKDIEWGNALNDYTTVSNRGMVVEGDLIYIIVSSTLEGGDTQMIPNFPSGVWCYDDTNKSLYHRYGPSYTRLDSHTNPTVDTTANDFELASGNLDLVITGMPVLYEEGGTSIPDLNESTAYYLIKDSSTEFKLATTYTNALAGTEIDITGVGDSNQKFHIVAINDYGWTVHGSRSAVTKLTDQQFEPNVANNVTFGADLFSKQNHSTEKAVINGVSPIIPNRGYFVTPKFTSFSVEDNYASLYLKYRPLDTDEKIIVKYKTIDKLGLPLTSVKINNTANWQGTWTDTDTFTSTQDLSKASAGDEVEIIAGVGSGHLAHISSITEDSGTYTVNLDEAFEYVAASDVMRFMIDNWTKAFEITSSSQNGQEVSHIPLAKASKFVQIKVEMRGVGITVEELIINNKTHAPVV